MPIYHVKTPTTEHIVEATNQAVAINHVVRGTITAENLTASELVQLMGKGLVVEKAAAGQAIENSAQPKTKE